MRIAGETECRRHTVFIRDHLSPRLVHANAPDILGDAQTIKQWQVQRQQRFANVETGELLLLQENDMLALLGKQRRDCGTGRPAADNEDIAFLKLSHGTSNIQIEAVREFALLRAKTTPGGSDH